MPIRMQARIGIPILGLGIALLVGAGAHGTVAQKTADTSKVQVAIGLDTKRATRAQLVREIRQQLSRRAVSASEQEVQSAARQTLDLISKAKDPEKGVIYVKTKKFTICASWGRDKTFCDSH